MNSAGINLALVAIPAVLAAFGAFAALWHLAKLERMRVRDEKQHDTLVKIEIRNILQERAKREKLVKDIQKDVLEQSAAGMRAAAR